MDNQNIYVSENISADLKRELQNYPKGSLFILTDTKSNKLCLPKLGDEIVSEAKVIEIQEGDEHKNLESLSFVWKSLSEGGAMRKSIMINLGGGVVTDLGGFAASTFKRGMNYINIPTTLLGAVDAAVGGKTGINFGGLKNEIGVINPAQTVILFTPFFQTLDHDNILSGYAEMIKHALIHSPKVWNDICAFDFDKIDYERLSTLLLDSVKVKQTIVKQDPNEKGIRKALNFGHTVGHAFESLALKSGHPRLHGYTVAWGMIAELYLSYLKVGLEKETLLQAVKFIHDNYGTFPITCKDYEGLYELMTHDKKNEGDGRILFTLISKIGDVKINIDVNKEEIFKALDFYCDAVGI